MRAEELLMNNMKYNLPYERRYDNRYADVSLHVLEENCGHDAVMCYELANRYRNGIGGAKKSPEKAYEYYQKVLYTQRNSRAMYWLGYLSLLFLPGMEQESLWYLKTADSLGEKDASWLLGYIFMDRPDIVPTDHEKAYELFLRAKEGCKIDTIDRYLGRCAEKLGMIEDSRKHYINGLNHGDKGCANYLGYMYYAGYGVEESIEYAKKFFSIGLESQEEDMVYYANLMISNIAMETGTAKEKFDAFVFFRNHATTDAVNMILGKTFHEGIPGYLEKNEDEALKYFEAVSDHQCGDAYYRIAWIYYGRMDKENGEKYILASANQGYAPALSMAVESNRLTLMHLRESFDPIVKEYNDKYDKASIREVKKAAETDPVAMYELGSRYRLGQDGAEKNLEEAAKWYRKVLWHQRNAGAMYHLGYYLDMEKEDEELAIAYWKFAYSFDNADAAVQLGIVYEHGTEQIKSDFSKAMQFYKFAKEHGRKDANSFIGALYQKMGQYAIAETYLRRALVQDPENSFAYADMGYFYIDNKNPNYNEDEAIRWFREAAKRGNESAKETLDEIEQFYKKETMNKTKPKSKKETKRIPSVIEFLREDNQLNGKGFNDIKIQADRMRLLIDAEKFYPDHPEILERLIDVSNFIYYGIKFTAKTDQDKELAYNGFKDTFRRINHLMDITGTNPKLEETRSFTVTHLAELAHEKGFETQVWDLLSMADRKKTPWSSVVAMKCLIDKGFELANNTKLNAKEKRRLMDENEKRVKNEVAILAKTVECEEGWNSQERERAFGYRILAFCYESNLFEPHIRCNTALAKMYLDKCAKLNPEMVR